MVLYFKTTDATCLFDKDAVLNSLSLSRSLTISKIVLFRLLAKFSGLTWRYIARNIKMYSTLTSATATTAVKLSLIIYGTGKTQLRYTTRQSNHNAIKYVLQYITRFIFTFRTKLSPQFDISTAAKTGDPVEINELHFCYMIVRKCCLVISTSPTSRLLGLRIKLTRIYFCYFID